MSVAGPNGSCVSCYIFSTASQEKGCSTSVLLAACLLKFREPLNYFRTKTPRSDVYKTAEVKLFLLTYLDVYYALSQLD